MSDHADRSSSHAGAGPSTSSNTSSSLQQQIDKKDQRYGRRATSPLDFRRTTNPATTAKPQVYTTALAALKGATKVTTGRPRADKFVPLPDANKKSQVVVEVDDEEGHHGDDLLDPLTPERGRITVICVAESFNRKQLEAALLMSYPDCTTSAYPEVMYARVPHGEREGAPGEAFFFDYGVVAFWGMSEMQEQKLLLDAVTAAAVEVLDESEKQVDELLFVYTASAQPNIQNDTITINRRQASDNQVKMAISHALAQSGKLSIYETRMVDLVGEAKGIPRAMAANGSVNMSRRQVAMLMGKVFLLKASIHLASTLLDTPEFFWRAPDHLQALYERVCEYLELGTRLSLLDARFSVLQRMLSIWTDHSAHHYLSRLDTIIVVLILIEVVMAAAEVVGFIVRHERQHSL